MSATEPPPIVVSMPWCENDYRGLLVRHMSIAAIILAGGDSHRMGVAKASLDTGGGVPLLAHVIERLRPACSVVVVSARAGQPLPPLPPSCVRVDDGPEFAGGGPLAGIGAALDSLGAAGEAAYLTSVDAALVTAAHVRYMAERLLAAPRTEAVLPVSRPGDPDEHAHPLASIVRVKPARRACAALLARREHRARELFSQLVTLRLPAAELPDPAVLTPCNTPEDWARVRQILAGISYSA
jgi:molybdenum cofactor guanylyltransferase